MVLFYLRNWDYLDIEWLSWHCTTVITRLSCNCYSCVSVFFDNILGKVQIFATFLVEAGTCKMLGATAGPLKTVKTIFFSFLKLGKWKVRELLKLRKNCCLYIFCRRWVWLLSLKKKIIPFIWITAERFWLLSGQAIWDKLEKQL